MTRNDDSIIAEIQMAFADNQYPGDDKLTVYDPAGREYDRTHQLLSGKKWTDFPIAEFLSGDTPIPDLTAHAFHYFLPGLLIASLGNDEAISADIVNTLTFFFSPSNARSEGEFAYDDRERCELRVGLLTSRQRDVVIRVLREYVDRGWLDQGEVEEAIAFLQRKAAGGEESESLVP